MCEAQTTEQHPYNCPKKIPEGTRTLIIGTAPPPSFQDFHENPESLDFNFFYGSEDNYMWPILECALAGEQRLLDDMNSAQCIAAAQKNADRKRLMDARYT